MYGSPCCPVVVGHYSSFIPSTLYAEYSKFMPYHHITAQRASKVLSLCHSCKLEEKQSCFVPL